MNLPSRAQIVAAFAVLYLIWGSTYLGIRFAIESVPPFLMGGTRFLLAGAILFVVARWRGAAWPTLADWRTAFIVGACLLLCGNGGKPGRQPRRSWPRRCRWFVAARC